MATMTQQQRINVEKNENFKENVRMAILSRAQYFNGLNGVGLADAAAAKYWFQNRSLAERFLAAPEVIDKARNAGKAIGFLQTENIAGIDENSTPEEIVDAISQNLWDTVATNICDELANEIPF